MAALTLERSRCNARVSSVLINFNMVFYGRCCSRIMACNRSRASWMSKILCLSLRLFGLGSAELSETWRSAAL